MSAEQIIVDGLETHRTALRQQLSQYIMKVNDGEDTIPNFQHVNVSDRLPFEDQAMVYGENIIRAVNNIRELNQLILGLRNGRVQLVNSTTEQADRNAV